MMNQANEFPPDSACPCCSELSFRDCCRPLLLGEKPAETAEQLMRSRYSAYFFECVDYLVETNHPDTRDPTLRQNLRDSVPDPQWLGLTILSTSLGEATDKMGKVKFVARYLLDGETHEMSEHSRFRRYKGQWRYLDGRG